MDVSEYREEELLSGSEDPESSEDGAEEIYQTQEGGSVSTAGLNQPPTSSSASSSQASSGISMAHDESRDKGHTRIGGTVVPGSDSSSPGEQTDFQR